MFDTLLWILGISTTILLILYFDCRRRDRKQLRHNTIKRLQYRLNQLYKDEVILSEQGNKAELIDLYNEIDDVEHELFTLRYKTGAPI